MSLNILDHANICIKKPGVCRGLLYWRHTIGIILGGTLSLTTFDVVIRVHPPSVLHQIPCTEHCLT